MKKVPAGSKGKGLSKLPKTVRNKMGYLKKGGTMKKAKGYKKGMYVGGMRKKAKGMAKGGMKKAKGYSKGGVAKKAKGMKRGGVKTRRK